MNNSEYKVCPQCQSENAAAAKFCFKCGANLEQVESRIRMLNGGALVSDSAASQGGFLITAGPIPAGHRQTMTIMAESLQSDGTTKVAWHSAMESLRNVLSANHLRGIANMKILNTSLFVNGRAVPAFTIYGDGLVSE